MALDGTETSQQRILKLLDDGGALSILTRSAKVTYGAVLTYGQDLLCTCSYLISYNVEFGCMLSDKIMVPAHARSDLNAGIRS